VDVPPFELFIFKYRSYYAYPEEDSELLKIDFSKTRDLFEVSFKLKTNWLETKSAKQASRANVFLKRLSAWI